jgi:hypothetical protein
VHPQKDGIITASVCPLDGSGIVHQRKDCIITASVCPLESNKVRSRISVFALRRKVSEKLTSRPKTKGQRPVTRNRKPQNVGGRFCASAKPARGARLLERFSVFRSKAGCLFVEVVRTHGSSGAQGGIFTTPASSSWLLPARGSGPVDTPKRVRVFS